MRILIVTDAWEPQVNGVVRTLQATIGELRAAGHEVEVISPDLFRSIPCPSYSSLRIRGPREPHARVEKEQESWTSGNQAIP